MSTLRIDNFEPSAGGTSFGIEGIAKALLRYDQTTPEITTDTNYSSVTDTGAGLYTPAFTNNFANANWHPSHNLNAIEATNSVQLQGQIADRATSGYLATAGVQGSATASLADNERNDDVIFGDLA